MVIGADHDLQLRNPGRSEPLEGTGRTTPTRPVHQPKKLARPYSHFEILTRMGKAPGLSRKEIESAKPLPTTIVATHAWETLTKNRTWYEGLAAKAVLERSNNPNCGNFSRP
jgi:hypothetical protein